MSTAIAPTAPAPDTQVESEAPRQWPYRMSYETYEQIAELGMIRPEEHVVLLDGILVQTMTKGPDHSRSMLRGQEVLRASCPPGWHVRPEQPIVIRNLRGTDSAPEPDLSVVLGNLDQYGDRHPGAVEVGLIIEVASSPAAFADDRRGLDRYAFAMVPTVWIVALHDRTVHVCTEPSGPSPSPSYARVEVRRAGELLEALLPAATPDQLPAVLGPIAVASFFPPIV